MKKTFLQSLGASGAARARKVVIVNVHAVVAEMLALASRAVSARTKVMVVRDDMGVIWASLLRKKICRLL